MMRVPKPNVLSNTRSLACAAFTSALLALQPALAADAPPAAPVATIPAGDYTLDKAHASLLLRVSHLGFSHFTARFARFDANLHFEPNQPSASRVDATIDARSIQADNTPSGFLDGLQGARWLDAANHPQITFRSTAVAGTPGAMQISGDFTLHGVTRPLVLIATFNGGYAGSPPDPHARVGFSAHGQFKRSDFGITAGLPAPGTQMGVGDDVEVVIEAEFNGPPWRAGPAASAVVR